MKKATLLSIAFLFQIFCYGQFGLGLQKTEFVKKVIPASEVPVLENVDSNHTALSWRDSKYGNSKLVAIFDTKNQCIMFSLIVYDEALLSRIISEFNTNYVKRSNERWEYYATKFTVSIEMTYDKKNKYCYIMFQQKKE
jgi:hypothetical protein